ncbi:oral cancer-overexpressed protein 1 isoform X2 [Pseudonaja textilis]|uniref:oral cancer-overexpressed protein 1 isoform X2 n=1 Tax=Pseudonaja textilis TaxID=8673 RepID=UPI000EA88517|nr:oral cancer-overexpressed protein 1 isoform X2 [Pseudonaja textilis]
MAAAEGESDAFDAIVMAETRFHGEGYQDGYAEGVQAGIVEGRQHGIQQGARIGSEIGSYLGFALTWQQLLQKTSDEKCSDFHYLVTILPRRCGFGEGLKYIWQGANVLNYKHIPPALLMDVKKETVGIDP